MATTYNTLRQSAPAATTETDLYTVPSNVSAIISSLVVCNRASSAATFRISIAPGGVATSNEQYIYYDLPLPANDTFIATIGITIPGNAIVRVYASSADLSFNLFGSEVSS